MDAVIGHFALPRERLSLVGGSFGGALAVWYAGERPGLRGVVSIDAAPYAVLATSPQRPEQRTAEQCRADGWGWSGDEPGTKPMSRKWSRTDVPSTARVGSMSCVPDGRYQAVRRPRSSWRSTAPPIRRTR